MSAEEHAWRFVDWVAGIAAAVASAALGFVMSSRDRLTKLEERVADHERYNLDRGPIIYSTKGRVDLLDAEVVLFEVQTAAARTRAAAPRTLAGPPRRRCTTCSSAAADPTSAAPMSASRSTATT